MDIILNQPKLNNRPGPESFICPICKDKKVITTTIEGTETNSTISVPCPKCAPEKKKKADYIREIPIGHRTPALVG